MSFLDDENQMIIDAEIETISEHLFNQWMDSNLDEGSFYADYQFAVMCDSKEIKQAFNQFYNLKEDDEHYVGL